MCCAFMTISGLMFFIFNHHIAAWLTGETPEQARNLAKGKTKKFSLYVLQTYTVRLSLSIK
jgi:hypothetical protein